MVWIQNYNPLSSLFFSVLFALLPLIALLYFLAIRHMKGLYACAISLGTAIALAYLSGRCLLDWLFQRFSMECSLAFFRLAGSFSMPCGSTI